MGAAQYRTPGIGTKDKDLEEYLSAYLKDRDSVGSLGDPLPGQAATDREYNEALPGRKYLTWFFRDDDVPDYDDLLEDSIDVDELDLDHLDAEGYGDDALDDYREAIEDVLAE